MAKCVLFRVEAGTGVVISGMRERGGGPLRGWAVPSDWVGAATGVLVEVEPHNPVVMERVKKMLSTSKLPLEIRNLHREFWGAALVKCRLCTRCPKIRRKNGPIAQFGTMAVCGQCLSLSRDKFQAKVFAAKQRGLIRPWDRLLPNVAEAQA